MNEAQACACQRQARDWSELATKLVYIPGPDDEEAKPLAEAVTDLPTDESSETVAVPTCDICSQPEVPPYCVHVKCVRASCLRKRQYAYGCVQAHCCRLCCWNRRGRYQHDRECHERNVLQWAVVPFWCLHEDNFVLGSDKSYVPHSLGRPDDEFQHRANYMVPDGDATEPSQRSTFNHMALLLDGDATEPSQSLNHHQTPGPEQRGDPAGDGPPKATAADRAADGAAQNDAEAMPHPNTRPMVATRWQWNAGAKNKRANRVWRYYEEDLNAQILQAAAANETYLTIIGTNGILYHLDLQRRVQFPDHDHSLTRRIRIAPPELGGLERSRASQGPRRASSRPLRVRARPSLAAFSPIA